MLGSAKKLGERKSGGTRWIRTGQNLEIKIIFVHLK